jgi:hypothetical protein
VLLLLYISSVFFPIREWFPVLQYLQMPFRVISITATLQLIGIASLFKWNEQAREIRFSRILLIVLAAAIVVTSEGGRTQGNLDFEHFRAGRENSFETMTHADEFRPLAASTKGLSPRLKGDPITADTPSAKVTINFNHADSDIGMDVQAVSIPATFVIDQFYFPGWKVTIDGNEGRVCPQVDSGVASYCTGPNGLIEVHIGSTGHHFVHAWYGGIPGENKRAIIALIVTVLSLVGMYKLTVARKAAI